MKNISEKSILVTYSIDANIGQTIEKICNVPMVRYINIHLYDNVRKQTRFIEASKVINQSI